MKDLSLNNNLRPISAGLDTSRTDRALNKADAGLFKEALSKASPTAASAPAQQAAQLKFSNHAVDRMQARGIRFSPDEMAKIDSAAAKAAAKGAKNCLLISDQAAMIVDVKDKTVVTVMDKTNLKENVFTNIDSTVLI